MNRIDEEELLRKYREGKSSGEELRWLEAWYADWNMKDRVVLSEADLEKAEMLMHDAVMERAEMRRVSLWPRIAVAAAVAVIISGVYFYNRHKPLKTTQQTAVVNDVAPGKNGATITLANGKVIKLSDARSGVVVGGGKIAYSSLQAGEGARQPHQDSQNEIASIPRNDVMELTASTAKGQTYQFTLPDGTKVWLNADSKIEFPSSFVNSKTRNIKLSGEGYFEVYKDKAHPFVVESGGQRVEVLGTQFNINAYNDEPGIKTTLAEGSVKINNEVILTPNQQAINVANKIKVQPADIENELAWKKGDFVFADEDFKTTMRKIARWYNLEIIYDESVPGNIALAGWVSRNSNLSTVLKRIELASKLHFTIEGRRVTVRK